MAIAQVEKFQSFASSPAATLIANQAKEADRRTYNLQDFRDGSSPQFRALLNFFNLMNGIAYLYNTYTLDRDFISDNILCATVKQYRTFVLAQSGGHGTVRSSDGSGIFNVGSFSDLDKMYNEWNSSGIRGQPVDVRCSATWRT